MLDDYSLRVLAEIGVDVYVPRMPAGRDPAPADQGLDARPSAGLGAESMSRAAEAARTSRHPPTVLILCSDTINGRLGTDLVGALRAAGLVAAIGDASDLGMVATVRALVVLGESLARRLGAELPAQQQRAIEWVVTAEASMLVGNATAKRALWGEIKRLSRSLARPSEVPDQAPAP